MNTDNQQHERDYYKERYNEKLMEAEQWLLERNAAQAHAAKLAEALRLWLNDSDLDPYEASRKALAEYEESKH